MKSLSDMTFDEGLDLVARRFAKTAAGGLDLGGMLQSGMQGAKGYWDSVGPENQQHVLSALAGGGIGGLLGGASSMMQPKERRNPWGRALTGALAGAVAGGGLSAAYSGGKDMGQALSNQGGKLNDATANFNATPYGSTPGANPAPPTASSVTNRMFDPEVWKNNTPGLLADTFAGPNASRDTIGNPNASAAAGAGEAAAMTGAGLGTYAGTSKLIHDA